jgi:DHA1 family tetracycline resistance protein-like MFS transporter
MRHSRASLRFILITVFVDMLGIGLMLPVLPSLVGELAGSPDLQSYWYGALMVTFGITQFLAMPLLGALSDRFGRRPVLLLSIFGLGSAYLISATTDSLLILLLSRVLSGATSASFTVANAYVADITTPAERSKGFGAIGAAFGLGFIVGPALGGILASDDLRLPFWIASAMALLNGLYGWFVLPESLSVERRRPLKLSQANPFGALKHLKGLQGVGLLIVVYSLILLAQWILQTTWVLYTSFRFQWQPADNGMALCLVGLMAVLAQGVFMGPLLQRFGEQKLAMMAMTSAMLASIGYGLIDQSWMLYLLITANILSFTASPALQGIISKAAHESEQGLTQGALNSIASLMTVIAPLIGTPLLGMVSTLPADDWRLGSTFFVSAGLQFMAILLARRHFRAAPSFA